MLTKLGKFKEAHRLSDQARKVTVRFKQRTITAQFDSTRAEILIAEGKFEAAEAVAHRAASALAKVGHRCWLADALILQAIAQARLGKPARAQITLQRAIEVAHEADALNKAGLAALTMIEEVDHLSPDTLQAAYQQARVWLADSQNREVLSRLNAAGGKLADSLCKEMSRDEAVDVLLPKPLNLDQRLLECEQETISQALSDTRLRSLLTFKTCSTRPTWHNRLAISVRRSLVNRSRPREVLVLDQAAVPRPGNRRIQVEIGFGF